MNAPLKNSFSERKFSINSQTFERLGKYGNSSVNNVGLSNKHFPHVAMLNNILDDKLINTYAQR